MLELELDKYINYIKEERKLSQNTVDAYIRDLASFKDYLNKNSKLDLFESNKTIIITYLSYLQKNGKAISTISRNLASLRCLYQYLLNNELIKEDPTFNLKSPKAERKLPNVLNKEEIELLLSLANSKTEKGSRDRAMIQLIFSVGLRVSEVLELNIEDLNMDAGLIKINQGETCRVVPLDEYAKTSLNDYLKSFRVNSNIRDPLFTNMSGERLSRQGIWKIFKQYNKMMDIDKDITPHVLRHSFAIHMLNSGASLVKIQKMLGHGDLSTIQSYLLISDDNK